jgi:hypothetical protein
MRCGVSPPFSASRLSASTLARLISYPFRLVLTGLSDVTMYGTISTPIVTVDRVLKVRRATNALGLNSEKPWSASAKGRV